MTDTTHADRPSRFTPIAALLCFAGTAVLLIEAACDCCQQATHVERLRHAHERADLVARDGQFGFGQRADKMMGTVGP